MTSLRCSVYSCAHHKGDCCCKPNIKVDGPGACTCGETRCASYAQRGDENSVGYTNPNDTLEVSCSARECVYNDHNRCHASSVSINTMSGTAGCSTFIKRD